MSKQNYNLWMTFGENQFFPDVSGGQLMTKMGNNQEVTELRQVSTLSCCPPI